MKKNIMLSILLLICFLLIGCDFEPKQITKPIKGLGVSDKTTVTSDGTFILGFGYYSHSKTTEKVYYFYVKGEEGWRFQELNAKHCEIVETDTVKPSIKGQYVYSDGTIDDEMDSFILYVPSGTLYQEYNKK